MRVRNLTILLWCFSAFSIAQQVERQQTRPQDAPEEIVVTRERSTIQLRIQLQESERLAYDIFNQLNEEKRFDISCSVQEFTGSRFTRQVCQPEFEIQATRGQAMNYYDSMPRPGGLPGGSITQQYGPMEMEIGRHQVAFQQKMKQVAEEHPEFLEAIARYAELKQQYRKRTGQTDE